MRSMFGNRISPDADRLRPFRARVSWLCHFIELRSMLGYYTLSGQILVTSPERETSLSEAVTPLANNRLITLANDMMKTFRILHDNNTSLR